jgi:selenocysteine-specific elongation factor
VVVYLGTAELSAQAILLEGDQLAPGEEGLVQLVLDGPAPMLPGDRLIVRLPAPAVTLAGGEVLDAAPRRHRRRDAELVASLARRARGDTAAGLVEELAKHTQGSAAATLAAALGIGVAELRAALPPLLSRREVVEAGEVLLTRAHWESWQRRIQEALAAYHAAQPLRSGTTKEELRSRAGVPAELLVPLLQQLAGDGLVVEDAREVRLARHRVALPPAQLEASRRLVEEVESGGFAPPTVGELMVRYPVTPAVLQHLVDQGQLVRVSDDVLLGRTAYDRAVQLIAGFIRQHGKITVAQARDVLGSSRKYVLPLLEWLDAQKITRRVGDERILR